MASGRVVERVSVDLDHVVEEMFERGWTDGLPVVPPTSDLVSEMLDGAGRDADDILGVVGERHRVVTAEVTAVNAVLAGCRPEYFPIVLAATEAMLDPAFNINTVATSTGGAGVAVFVSGPMAEEIGMNSGTNALGPGNRANATIGRAVRLVVTNALGAKSGVLDASSLGHPGKFTLCIAESEPMHPWTPLRVDQGYTMEDTTVTVAATEGPRQVANHLNADPEGILRTFAASLSNPSVFISGRQGGCALVFGPEHAAALIDAGWTKERARVFIAEHARVSPADLVAAGQVLPDSGQDDMSAHGDGLLPTVETADSILILTAGGHGAGWSATLNTWAGARHSRFTTRRVRPRDESLPDCGPDACEIPWSTDAATILKPAGS